MMNVAHVVLFITDPSEHCGYPMDVQLRLPDEVKGMVSVPVIVTANKSDIVAADGYLAMSTADGSGIDLVLAEILVHKPAPEPRKRSEEIRAPLPFAEEEPVVHERCGTDAGEGPKRRRVRRPRTKP
jgi:nucleolar GTP-binding protein